MLPTDIQELKRMLEVKREKGVVYDRRGKRRWEDLVFVRIFAEFQESGWLARLSPSELKVLISLSLRMDEKRKAYPSVERIARDTGYSARQVIRTLQQLEKRGLISRKKRRDSSKRYRSNLYTILPGWIRGIE
jgi:DNA-binding MarR family transcriptional regulator